MKIIKASKFFLLLCWVTFAAAGSSGIVAFCISREKTAAALSVWSGLGAVLSLCVLAVCEKIEQKLPLCPNCGEKVFSIAKHRKKCPQQSEISLAAKISWFNDQQ